jgi:integrase
MGRRSPGDGGLYKRKSDNMWIGAVTLPSVDGRQHRKTVSAKSRAKCLEKKRELEKQIAAGILPTAPKMTVEQWLVHWLETICRPRVKPKTFNYYREAVHLHLIPHIGTKKLAKLSQADVRALRVAVQSYSTRNAVKAHQALQKALKDAVREGYVARNVAQLTDKPKHVVIDRGALTADAARHLLRVAIDRGDPLATRWAAAFLTGARPAELIGLTWDRVDLERGLLDLSWQLQEFKRVHGCDPDDPCGKLRGGDCPRAKFDFQPGFEHIPCHRSLVWTRPKTFAGKRAVPITAPLLAMLRAYRAADNSGVNPHQLVWHHDDGRPISPRDDRESWIAACEAAGLAKRKPLPEGASTAKRNNRRNVEWEIEPPVEYVTRHTTATLLLEAGVPEEVRMAIMGQSSREAHQGYLHVDLSLPRAAVAELDLLPALE